MNRIRSSCPVLSVLAIALMVTGPNAQAQGVKPRSTPGSATKLTTITIEPLPPGVSERYAKLSPGLNPGVRAWAQAEAKGVEAGNLSAAAILAQIHRDVETRFAGQKPTTGAVNAMTLLVLTDVARSAQNSLRGSKERIGASSTLSEEQSLRLQMAMDRMSKMMSTLSNLLKKASDTDTGLVQNLK